MGSSHSLARARRAASAGVLAALTACLATALATGVAGAEKVNLKPVRGATYTGLVDDVTISVKVSGNAKTATVSLKGLPAYCQGGSGPVTTKTKPATISKSGAVKATVAFTSSATHKVFADVLVKGNFYTFGKSTPVFDGQAKTTFLAAASKACNGEQSFEAVK